MTNGPKRKFELIKAYGADLRARGIDPNTMSCSEIETELRRMGADFTDGDGNYWGHCFEQ